MRTERILSLAFAVALLTACDRNEVPTARQTPQPQPVPPQIAQLASERGKAIITQAFGVLSSNLLSALEKGGPTNALPFCSAQAQSLTESLAAAGGVELRRVSHRPRNPTNEASEVEFAVMQGFDQALRSGQKPTPVVATTPKGQIAFYTPIAITNAVCLNCHGQPNTEVQPATMALIGERYPKDRATGFKMGDLRGMWVITFRQDAFPPAK